MPEEVMIPKMSIKGIGCKPAGAPAATPKRLCVILGKASGIKTGEDNTGRIWSALTGMFLGKNLETDETFRSGKLFLPSGIHDAVEAAVKTLPPDGGVVKFALELRSVEAKNPIGYSYQAVNLIPMEAETDELAELVALIPAPTKAIAPGPQLPAVPVPEIGKAKK